ncbi:MAG: 4-(cytidine 5'-diphospho)-2-C-methyl-D-erythritol kinase [Planctomycetota bacterium]
MTIISWTEADDGARLRLPAKLNLFLEISGRRDDGFHELTTLMVPIDLCDELHVRELAGGSDRLDVVGFEAGANDDNLVMQALRLAREYGDIPPLAMTLHKRVPAGAGLGGGSSDAAGVLKFLHARYPSSRDRDLSADAAQLGSDVPFFLGDGAAIATGRGECITPFPGTLFGDDKVVFALILPALHSSSAAAYGHVTLPLTSPDGPISFHPRLFTKSRTWVSALFNRLEYAVLASHSKLQSLARWLDHKVAGRWRMTGSGSGFFVVCDSEPEAHALIEGASREPALNSLNVSGVVARPVCGSVTTS